MGAQAVMQRLARHRSKSIHIQTHGEEDDHDEESGETTGTEVLWQCCDICMAGFVCAFQSEPDPMTGWQLGTLEQYLS